jgi:uracil-DNA glycosylase
VASKDGDAKREKLAELRTRMEQRFRHDFPEPDRWLWFFEGNDEVAGYLGTEPVMFVGQRPSTGKGGTARVALGGFYGLLVDYGFAKAHVTDLVKERMKVGTPSDDQVKWNWPFLREELDIIRPKVVVALGGWVHETLEQRIPYLLPIERMTHYSYRFANQLQREKRLRGDLARIRTKVDATAASCCREDNH